MSGIIEFGKCDICGNEDNLQRKYYKYDIKCECHSPYHFEIVRHCKECKPVEPIETRILAKTSNLNKID